MKQETIHSKIHVAPFKQDPHSKKFQMQPLRFAAFVASVWDTSWSCAAQLTSWRTLEFVFSEVVSVLYLQ